MSRRRTWIPVLIIGGLLAAGGGCGSSPSAPTPPAPPQTPAPSPGLITYTLNGRVVATVTGQPIGGATVTIGGQAVKTDADGAFSLTDATRDVRDVVVSGDGLVTRESRLFFAGRDLTIDVIQNQAPFDLTFFRRLARNAAEADGGLEPLRPLSSAPRIHIRTVDEA